MSDSTSTAVPPPSIVPRPEDDEEMIKISRNGVAFKDEIVSTLATFEKCSDWSDYNQFLQRLQKSIIKYNDVGAIPVKVVVAKRLSQCLNPNLPSGVHVRTLDIYQQIFDKIGLHALCRDISLYVTAMFAFYSHASIQIKPTILRIYETYLVPLGYGLQPCLTGLISSLVGGTEEEDTENSDRVRQILLKIKSFVGQRILVQALWRAVLFNPSARALGLTFLSTEINLTIASEKSSPEVVLTQCFPDISTLVLRAICTCLEDRDILVQRNVLDLLTEFFPFQDNKFNINEKIIILRSALWIILRREVSLVRRLSAWLLGTSTATPTPDTSYFENYVRRPFTIALSQLLQYHSHVGRTHGSVLKLVWAVAEKPGWLSIVNELLINILTCIQHHLLQSDKEINYVDDYEELESEPLSESTPATTLPTGSIGPESTTVIVNSLFKLMDKSTIWKVLINSLNEKFSNVVSIGSRVSSTKRLESDEYIESLKSLHQCLKICEFTLGFEPFCGLNLMNDAIMFGNDMIEMSSDQRHSMEGCLSGILLPLLHVITQAVATQYVIDDPFLWQPYIEFSSMLTQRCLRLSQLLSITISNIYNINLILKNYISIFDVITTCVFTKSEDAAMASHAGWILCLDASTYKPSTYNILKSCCSLYILLSQCIDVTSSTSFAVIFNLLLSSDHLIICLGIGTLLDCHRFYLTVLKNNPNSNKLLPISVAEVHKFVPILWSMLVSSQVDVRSSAVSLLVRLYSFFPQLCETLISNYLLPATSDDESTTIATRANGILQFTEFWRRMNFSDSFANINFRNYLGKRIAPPFSRCVLHLFDFLSDLSSIIQLNSRLWIREFLQIDCYRVLEPILIELCYIWRGDREVDNERFIYYLNRLRMIIEYEPIVLIKCCSMTGCPKPFLDLILLPSLSEMYCSNADTILQNFTISDLFDALLLLCLRCVLRQTQDDATCMTIQLTACDMLRCIISSTHSFGHRFLLSPSRLLFIISKITPLIVHQVVDSISKHNILGDAFQIHAIDVLSAIIYLENDIVNSGSREIYFSDYISICSSKMLLDTIVYGFLQSVDPPSSTPITEIRSSSARQRWITFALKIVGLLCQRETMTRVSSDGQQSPSPLSVDPGATPVRTTPSLTISTPYTEKRSVLTSRISSVPAAAFADEFIASLCVVIRGAIESSTNSNLSSELLLLLEGLHNIVLCGLSGEPVSGSTAMISHNSNQQQQQQQQQPAKTVIEKWFYPFSAEVSTVSFRDVMRSCVGSHIPEILSVSILIWLMNEGAQKTMAQDRILYLLSPIASRTPVEFCRAIVCIWDSWRTQKILCGTEKRAKFIYRMSLVRILNRLDVISPEALVNTIVDYIIPMIKVLKGRRAAAAAAVTGAMPPLTLVQSAPIHTKENDLMNQGTHASYIQSSRSKLTSSMEFLELYVRQCGSIESLSYGWPSLLKLFNEALVAGSNAPALSYVLIRVFDEFVRRVPVMTDKKKRKELQDVCCGMLTACAKALRAPIVKTGGGETSNTSSDFELLPPSDFLVMLVGESIPISRRRGESSVESSNLMSDIRYRTLCLLSSRLTSVLRMVFLDDKDIQKGISLLSSSIIPDIIPYLKGLHSNNVTLYLKGHTGHPTNIPFAQEAACVVANLSQAPMYVSAWKKAAWDVYSDDTFFKCNFETLRKWMIIIRNICQSPEGDRLRDLLTAKNSVLFTTSEHPLVRSMMLKRLAFIVLSCDKDAFPKDDIKNVDEILKRIAASFRLNDPYVAQHIFLLLRVMILKINSKYLTTFWPLVLTELYKIFENGGRETDPALLLSALKFIDLVIVARPEEFHIYHWMFLNEGNAGGGGGGGGVGLGPFIPRLLDMTELPVFSDSDIHRTFSFKPCRPLITIYKLQQISDLRPFLLELAKHAYNVTMCPGPRRLDEEFCYKSFEIEFITYRIDSTVLDLAPGSFNIDGGRGRVTEAPTQPVSGSRLSIEDGEVTSGGRGDEDDDWIALHSLTEGGDAEDESGGGSGGQEGGVEDQGEEKEGEVAGEISTGDPDPALAPALY